MARTVLKLMLSQCVELFIKTLTNSFDLDGPGTQICHFETHIYYAYSKYVFLLPLEKFYKRDK